MTNLSELSTENDFIKKFSANFSSNDSLNSVLSAFDNNSESEPYFHSEGINIFLFWVSFSISRSTHCKSIKAY